MFFELQEVREMKYWEDVTRSLLGDVKEGVCLPSK